MQSETNGVAAQNPARFSGVAPKAANPHHLLMRNLLFLMLFLVKLPDAAAASGTISGEYTGISHGLAVLKLSGTLTLTSTGYAAHVRFQTAGLASLFSSMSNDSEVTGVFDGGRALPQHFSGSGHFHGSDRVTRIDYVDGNPVIRTLSPPVEQERTPIAAADTVHTIDTLSALALLVRQMSTQGTCAGSVTTFDGRRLAAQTAQAGPDEDLPKTPRSSFAGHALRCDFDGRQLGGFVKDENEDDLRKPRRGTAWFAALVPGAPLVPVKINFENKLLGQVTLYLTSFSGAPAPSR